MQDRLARSPAAAIAADVIAWLERLAPVDSRRAFKTVREAQQAFEGLVSGGALAMGITPARVKGVLTAIAALAEAPASPASIETPSSGSQELAPSIRTSAPERADARGTASATVDAAAGATAGTDADIDIEALLALEAELEGGTSAPAPAAPFERHPSSAPSVGSPAVVLPVPEPVAAEPTVPEPTVPESVVLEPVVPEPLGLEPVVPEPFVPAKPDVEPALDALALERHDLERQFAALLDTVAPADEAPIHLIPETPLTSEPLVDARVLWSSMPADVTDLAEPIVDAVADDAALSMLVDDAVDADVPEAVPVPDVDAEAVVDAVSEVPEVLVSEEPIVVPQADEPLLAATVEHVPSDWWKEALPWRVEEQATPESAAVGEDFGYLSLDDIEARATDVEPVPEAELGVAADAPLEATTTNRRRPTPPRSPPSPPRLNPRAWRALAMLPVRSPTSTSSSKSKSRPRPTRRPRYRWRR